MQPLSLGPPVAVSARVWGAALVRPAGASATLTAILDAADAVLLRIYDVFGPDAVPSPPGVGAFTHGLPDPVPESTVAGYSEHLSHIMAIIGNLNDAEQAIGDHLTFTGIGIARIKNRVAADVATLNGQLGAAGSGHLSPAIEDHLIRAASVTLEDVQRQVEYLTDRHSAIASGIGQLRPGGS